ncbi:UDP-glucuronosyl/UDP-glucosyltransferase [Corchorus capsularis]|uniref:UDP-glucuronosyl/UDP-glucosyltransferase n=1 Tax=Corchorus capsularis TaxID=210143 RepID=A0A1R3H6Y5_COCAP|nr:UDP-glucuronosyl/UDP-glucosyltransferase [Corchorus capsularis]
MEGPYVDLIKTQFQKKVLLSGPLTPEPQSGVLEQKWADWLGQHPPKSVIFCSFGSETFLNKDQIKELATGLELTGLPFFLVLNFPTGVNGQAELEQALPKGFMEAIEGRGVIQTGWVQQQLILAHQSVGCYVCHSGFSSVIEALMNDCQLVLLPFKGDQFLNSNLMAGDLKAAVEVTRREEDGFFTKEDIRDAVKTVMVEVDDEPGMSIRENHNKWKQFLLNSEIQAKFISDLVQEMKVMA